MAQTAQLRRIGEPENEAQRVFQRQREACLAHPYPDLEARRAHLRALDRVLVDNRDAIADAIHRDFGHRSAEESLMLELLTSVDGIRHTVRKLRRWMRPQRRSTSVLFATGSNRLVPQPKGVVGIVSPWNYPLLLTVSPLTSALAAGNRAMVKMASHSQNLCRLLHEKIGAVIPEDVVAILPGVPAREFSTLPYDHLLFTGSAEAGRTVMHAAADNLTPVTLELGGKSPTIVCDDFDVEEAASRILYAKFVNAGQTCLAPDYLFLPEGRSEAFVAAARRILPERYPDVKDPSYTSIIDEPSYRRLCETLEDAEARGATVVPLVPGAAFDEGLRKIPPHLVLDIRDDMRIMREEIFGPLLPVKTYLDLDEVIGYVNAQDRPLGLYVFTHDRERREKILYNTLSGGVTVNDCMLHVAQHDQPFGGIGASGMGQYHGFEGFVELSKMRPVFTTPKLSMLHLFYPPYGARHRRLLDLLLRWKR